MSCPHFGVCGGCSKQDRSYEDQLKEKQQLVQEALHDVPVQEFLPILPSPDVRFYRNKMEFSFGDERDVAILAKKSPKDVPAPRAVHLGLHPRKRFSIVTPTPDCGLLSKESQIINNVVSDWATKNQIVTYTRHNHQGDLRHLVIREGKNTNQRLVNLFSTSQTPHVEALAQKLKDAGVPITTLLWTKNDGLSDVAQGPTSQIFWGDGVIEEQVWKIHVRIPPGSFMQTNTRASEKMIQHLDQWIQMDRKFEKGGLLFDLYCGVGTIGLNLMDSFDQLIGIEINPEAVTQAKANAAKNKKENTEFVAGRAEELMAAYQDQLKSKSSVMVVDPPRAGLHAKVLEAVAQSDIAHLYYVSCNPQSLARDLRALEGRYRIQTVQPMDFFPPHRPR